MALWRYINLVLLLLLLFHLEKSGIFSARKVKQIMIFLKRFGPTDQIRMSSWNGYITSPAVWGPSADRSRLEVQLHWRLCRGSWYASTWSEYALGVLNFPSKETIIDYFCHARIKFCLKLCSTVWGGCILPGMDNATKYTASLHVNQVSVSFIWGTWYFSRGTPGKPPLGIPQENEPQRQRHITLIQRHKPHSAAAAALSVTDRAGVQPTRRSPSPCMRTLTCNQTAIRSPGLPFDGLHPPNPCWLPLIYRPGRDERLSGLVGRPVADSSPAKWSRHRSGKVRQPKTDVSQLCCLFLKCCLP